MTDLGTTDFVGLQEIGRGGFGVVYTAHEPAFDRTVAVKVLTLTDVSTLRRFDRERQALGKVSNHPHITPVFASGFTTDGMPYLAMEFMRGGSLADRLERDGAMPWEEVLDLGVKLSGALETAHRAGILHRDIKPANILLSDFGEPRLADFGIASLDDGEQTKTGAITASVAFAAPEVLDGVRPGVQADIYGLGATLFCLVQGWPAFKVAGEQSLLPMVVRVARDPVPDLRPMGVPDALSSILEKSMAKAAGDRYQRASDLGDALRDAQSNLGLRPTPMVLPSDADAWMHVDAVAPPPANGGPAPAPMGHSASKTVVGLQPPTIPVEGAPVAAEPAWGPGQPVTSGKKTRRTAVLAAGALGIGLLGIGAFVATRDDPIPVTEEVATVTEAEVQPTVATSIDDSPGPDGGWQSVRPLTLPRQQVPAAASRGIVWVAGGLIDGGVTASTEGFELTTNSWRAGPDLPTPLHHHMTAVLDGEVVVMGGWSPDGALLSAITSDQVWALRDGEWVELPPMLQSRAAGAAATVGDLIVVTGGQDEAGQLIDSAEVFDGTSWREAAAMPTPREHLAAATDGTWLYAVGGRVLTVDASLPTLERYNPATDVWEQLPDMPNARGGLAAAAAGSALYAIGGERAGGVHDLVEVYDIESGVWSTSTPLPTGRHGLGASIMSGALVTIGGALEASHAAATPIVEVLSTG